MTDSPATPSSGAFAEVPNIRLLIDRVPRGTIETRDWEQWDPEGPYTNWWWLTLQRDDGIWVEGSADVELSADSQEALQLRTAAAIRALIAVEHPHYSFAALPLGPLTEPEPSDAQEGETSVVFAEVNALLSAVLLHVMGD